MLFLAVYTLGGLNVESKSLFQSKTMLGLCITVIAMFAPKFGWSINDTLAIQFADEAVGLIGAAIAFYGRVKASGAIKKIF